MRDSRLSGVSALDLAAVMLLEEIAVARCTEDVKGPATYAPVVRFVGPRCVLSRSASLVSQAEALVAASEELYEKSCRLLSRLEDEGRTACRDEEPSRKCATPR